MYFVTYWYLKTFTYLPHRVHRAGRVVLVAISLEMARRRQPKTLKDPARRCIHDAPARRPMSAGRSDDWLRLLLESGNAKGADESVPGGHKTAVYRCPRSTKARGVPFTVRTRGLTRMTREQPMKTRGGGSRLPYMQEPVNRHHPEYEVNLSCFVRN